MTRVPKNRTAMIRSSKNAAEADFKWWQESDPTCIDLFLMTKERPARLERATLFVGKRLLELANPSRITPSIL